MASVRSEVNLDQVVALADFEPIARERMARPGFDYVAGGAWDEITLAENVEAWRRRRFVPRVLTGVHDVDLQGTFLGRTFPLPIAIPPMAMHELAHPEGEVETIRGAAAAGIPYCLATPSSRSIEDVAAAAPDAERWFQLYLVGSISWTRSLVERAADAGYRAIVMTVDFPVGGYRQRDRRSGFVMPKSPHDDPERDTSQNRYGGVGEFGLSWATVEEVRSWSPLPLVLKGILSPEDARIAVESGAAAVVVSNHGARQLDRAIATADALPAIVDAVAGRCEVWVDGGIRRGLDVLIAFALGATGVMIGRPMYWALAAAGAEGIERAAAIVREELELGLALVGSGTLAELDRSLIR